MAERLAQRLTQRRRFTGEEMARGLDEDDLAAEPADGLGELSPGRAATQHDQPSRNAFHARRLTRAPHAGQLAQPGDRRHDWIGAVGQDDVRRGVADTVDLDDAGAGKSAGSPEQVDSSYSEPLFLARVGPVRDHEIPPGKGGRDVDLGARGGLPGAGDGFAWPEQGL